ncbi:MAG: hypothetical protein ABI670_04165 [Chloroflexota bacterium]
MDNKKNQAKPQADTGLLAATALTTFVAALGVSGGTNVVMHFTGNKLIKEHRPTLTFRSAIFGDGVLLPIISTLMMKSFVQWKPRMGSRASLASIVGGSALSLVFHIGQGRGGLVNWTMTRPWRWNLLGYYHFVYMSTQFSYMMLYLMLLAGKLPKGEIDAGQKRDLTIIGVCLGLFALLLVTDYY